MEPVNRPGLQSARRFERPNDTARLTVESEPEAVGWLL